MEYLTEIHSRFVIASLILSECNWSVCLHLEWEGDQQQQKTVWGMEDYGWTTSLLESSTNSGKNVWSSLFQL